MSDRARYVAAAALARDADHAAALARMVLPSGHEADSIRDALAGARSALERAADGLRAAAAIEADECPYCAPDEPCALHTAV